MTRYDYILIGLRFSNYLPVRLDEYTINMNEI